MDKKRDGEISLRQMFEIIKSDEKKIIEFTRSGKPNAGKDRLMKVQLGSVEDKRTKDGNECAHECSKVFITPDQTKEERRATILKTKN